MPRLISCALAIGAAFGVATLSGQVGASPVMAQSPGPPSPEALRQPGAPLSGPATSLRCADFRREHNGSWLLLHTVTIGPVTLTPPVSFSRRVRFSGIDLAAALDEHCLTASRP